MLTEELNPLRATTLYSQNMIGLMNPEPPALHGSAISCVHFRELVGWVLSVNFLCLLILIHSKVSTSGIETCLGMLDNVLESFEPVLPSLWHSGFTWLQPGLYRALKTTLS